MYRRGIAAPAANAGLDSAIVSGALGAGPVTVSPPQADASRRARRGTARRRGTVASVARGEMRHVRLHRSERNGRQRLDFVEEWWILYAEPNLERSTLAVYRWAWEHHARPRLGGLRLRDVTPLTVARFRA